MLSQVAEQSRIDGYRAPQVVFTQRDVFTQQTCTLFRLRRAVALDSIVGPPQFVLQGGELLFQGLLVIHWCLALSVSVDSIPASDLLLQTR